MPRSRPGRLRTLVLALALLRLAAAAEPALAQSGGSAHPRPAPSLRAVERTSAIALDGRLDEDAWRAAVPATGFTQWDPDEGSPETQRTEVRILYDAEALYVGARMYDSLGAAGVRTRLVRRDASMDSDWFSVTFDSFHDHLGRGLFQVNPSGVKYDGLAVGGSNVDVSWDPIWEVATSVDSLGWVAEMRIPLSQLRFVRDSAQTWGLQLQRYLHRRNEQTQWAWWTKTESGGPAFFGHLQDVRFRARPRHFEILPYVVGRSSFVEPSDAENPFQRDAEHDYRVGGDVKYLLTSNLTLDAAINPDFGQVEVDPAVVNLSAFETFFPEKRPFFIEGGALFNFGSFSCFFCSNVSSLDLFYSRRIGRQPQGAAAGKYVDAPENTTILGAAKVTGRTRRGFSLGVLEALTREERARAVSETGVRSVEPVEPITNYFAARGKRDFRSGNLVVGGMLTSVYRDLPNEALVQRLNKHSEALGTDLDMRWRNRTYRLMAKLALSRIAGDSNAILRAQRSSARYFQRPDRDNSDGLFSDAYDSSATSMTGHAGYLRLAKDAGKWLWEGAVNWRSPGFEVNDISFLTRADYVWMSGNLLRQYTTPTRRYRALTFIVGGQQQLNHDGDFNDRQVHGFVDVTLPNFWVWNAFYIHRPAILDDRLTRGGPIVKRATNGFAESELSTDSRKRLVLSVNPTYARNAEGAVSYSLDLGVTVKPTSNVSLSLTPSFGRSATSAQYVTTGPPDPTAGSFYGRRYLFADLVQRTLSMDTRLDVTFTPTLSLQLYAQPFISSADYTDFKEFDRPRALAKSVYGRDRGEIEQVATDDGIVYRIHPLGRGGAAPRIDVPNPDFNLRSLRGNAVVRWEYRPGSTIFFVWTQTRSDQVPLGNLAFGRDRSALFHAHPDNIFLVKVNYWLGM